MNEVMKFLGDVNTPVAVATVDGDQPRVRFLGFKMVADGKLYFLTSKKKAIYKELEANNKVELCTLPNPALEWVRITGKAVFVTDVELNKKAFELLPLLEKAYGAPDNDEIVLLSIEDMEIRKQSLGGVFEILEF